MTADAGENVDKIKPSSAAVMQAHRVAEESSVEYIRAYEAAVVETDRKALANADRVSSPRPD
jgi:hypothetical protein